jgi:hypothetical protein
MLLLSLNTAFFTQPRNFDRVALLIDVRTWFQFWVPFLSHDLCAPVFECIYAFCNEHSLIRIV